jgi:histidine ammonia-lyase
MATHAGTKARRIAGNSAGVVGIELLAGAQGCDFHAPLTSSPALEAARAEIRRSVPHYEADRYLADELRWAQEAVLAGALSGEVEAELFER